MVPDADFIEIYCDATIEVCEARDVKGMYKKARAGVIKDFTGINAPYEPPENPEIHLRTDKMTVDECVEAVMDYLMEHNYIPCSPNKMHTSYCTHVACPS